MELDDNTMIEKTPEIIELWNRISKDEEHHIIIAEEDGKIVCSCV